MSPKKIVEKAVKEGQAGLAEEKKEAEREQQRAERRRKYLAEKEQEKKEAEAKARSRSRTAKEEVEWALSKSGQAKNKTYSRDSYKSLASPGPKKVGATASAMEVTPMLIASPTTRVSAREMQRLRKVLRGTEAE